MTLQEKLDAAKAMYLMKIEKHILSECEGWADWPKLSAKEKEDVINGYNSCYFAGFDAAMSVIKAVYLKLPITRD